jgi:transcriptional regulator with XRE-family HTH domain
MRAQALVARNLRRLRVKRNLSQEALAADANIDRTYVSRLERGLENPTVALLEQLSDGLCQLSRLLIDDVSAILPHAQAVSRMPSAIAALRMCCQRRVAAGTRWRMRDRQRRKFRSSSWPQQYRLADPVLFNPSIGRHRPLMPR